MDDLDVTGNAPSPPTQTNGHSGITLVLPSLRALQAANAGKKAKTKQTNADLDSRPKIQRPIKLKPLKEVLSKLIVQIKKKDDYAFFIHPVDPARVPGYADVIKTPMDFGTMTVKVTKGKYRSLEEFTSDFRLVTANAKTFNPPGSIYHTEADRLEAWGLEHIARASAHVIEYETDWNIDIEQDEDASTSLQQVNIDDEVSTPRDLDGSMAAGSPAPSMTPAPGQAPMHGQGRRGPRGPYKKHAQTPLSEGLDAEGRMPGVKEGVGVFPAGSDWAELMIALKIKGKRYKTKKERLRFEKEGPPYLPDGSLDYAEIEDPFSVLNVFVPEPPTRPQVAPLYPPSSTTMSLPIVTPDSTQPQSQTPQPQMLIPTPVTVPSHRPLPVLSTLSNVSTPTPVTASTSVPVACSPKKRHHWTIVRNAPARSRGKDKDGDAAPDDAKTTWKAPRDAGPTDYGSFATLLGELAASVASQTTHPGTSSAAEYMYGSEYRLFATIRSTVERRGVKRKSEDETHAIKTEEEDPEAFWTDARAEAAWDHLRDVVYGGVDGYAYVRSLAEFVAPSVYLDDVRQTESEPGGGDVDVDVDVKPAVTSLNDRASAVVLPLGVSLARYVEDNLVDMVTRGRHGLLRDVLFPAATRATVTDPACASVVHSGDATPFHVRAAVLPGAARAMVSPQERYDGPLDMAALIRVPEELAKEGVLEGGSSEVGERAEIERALVWNAEVFETLVKQAGKGHAVNTPDSGDENIIVKKEEEEEEEEEEEAHTDKGADAHSMDVDAGSGSESDDDSTRSRSGPKHEPDVSREEDPLMKRLRLNLLALAKRAPLDQIAKLPVELVPEHIREIVPTV